MKAEFVINLTDEDIAAIADAVVNKLRSAADIAAPEKPAAEQPSEAKAKPRKAAEKPAAEKPATPAPAGKALQHDGVFKSMSAACEANPDLRGPIKSLIAEFAEGGDRFSNIPADKLADFSARLDALVSGGAAESDPFGEF